MMLHFGDMNDELAPEIADLLNQKTRPQPTSISNESEDTDFYREDFSVKHSETGLRKPVAPYAPVDLLIKEFLPVTKFFSDTRTTEIFYDPNYYKACLSGENETANRLHNLLSKFLTCQDPKDRTVYRQQMVNVYWEFVKTLAPKMNNRNIHQSKRMLLRYGVVLPSLFTQEQKEVFSTAFVDNDSNEPVYYLDEWFRDIGSGRVNLSATDEARPQKKATAGSSEEQTRLVQLKTKNAGKLQTAENYLAMKESERAMLEAELKSRVDILCDHSFVPGFEPHKAPYSESQKRLFAEISDKLRLLQKNDKELASLLNEYQETKQICDSLDQKIQAGPELSDVSSSDLTTEVDTVRQMSKMTVGRQGNHFPIFTREYYHCIPKGTGFRENVLSILGWIESVDPGVFCRVHKNIQNRIVPFVILVPTYGDTGFCWEPFDRYNRITSRGRIVVPMYPKNLQIAILTAVADLRWQVAKEKASYYWMEEGLTGQYYQWLVAQKLKGDIKDYFINDYVLWMTKECEGVQRLDKDVRGIFWRHMPFSQEIKEKLKTRSLVYQELYQRDINRSMSDGY